MTTAAIVMDEPLDLPGLICGALKHTAKATWTCVSPWHGDENHYLQPRQQSWNER